MLKKLSVILSLFIALTPSSQAAFQVPLQSVRAASMGNAFMASADEPAALFTNPAGIARLGYPEMSFMYGKPFAGLEDVNLNLGHAVFALPTRIGHLGVGIGAFQAPGLTTERTLAFTYARSLFQTLQLGVGVKHLHHSFDIDSDPLAAADPVFASGTAESAFAFDAGMIAPVGKMLRFGLSARNVNQPDVGLVSKDTVPREIQAGLAIDMKGIGMQAVGDVFMRSNKSGLAKNRPAAYVGVEKSFYKDMFALRFGANDLEFAAGFGIRRGAVGFDYGMVFNKNLSADNFGTHRLSMSYRFLPKPKEFAPVAAPPAPKRTMTPAPIKAKRAPSVSPASSKKKKTSASTKAKKAVSPTSKAPNKAVRKAR